jgi:hypothetical protein
LNLLGVSFGTAVRSSLCGTVEGQGGVDPLPGSNTAKGKGRREAEREERDSRKNEQGRAG